MRGEYRGDNKRHVSRHVTRQPIFLVCLASLALNVYHLLDVGKCDWVTTSYRQQEMHQEMQGPTVLSSVLSSALQENNVTNNVTNNSGNVSHDVFCPNATRMFDLCQSGFGSDLLWQWLPKKRADRFPSVQDRVKLYMGNWYLPPCTSSSKLVFDWDYSKNETFPDLRLQFRNDFRNKNERNQATSLNTSMDLTLPTTNVSYAEPQVLWNEALWSAKDGTQRCFNNDNGQYCNDMRFMTSIAQQITGTTHLSQLQPIIGQMGDSLVSNRIGDYPVPMFMKARFASTKTDLRDVTTDSPHRCKNQIGSNRRGLLIPARHLKSPNENKRYQPIIMPFTIFRHFNYADLRAVSTDDVPWENKKEAAVWRGTMTNWKPISPIPNLTFQDICNFNPRCVLVERHWNSSLIDVGITKIPPNRPNKILEQKGIPKYILKNGLSIADQLRYKAIISIEGNDVATGLKWQLLSNSVVIMPVPTRTSYAMEEALEPWVHFVPIEREDMSDLEDKMQWVLEHDREARTIAERGKLFVADLLFHEDSAKDNDEIYTEILKRYFQFFKRTTNPNPPHRTPLQESPLPSLREKIGVNDKRAMDSDKVTRIMFTLEQ